MFCSLHMEMRITEKLLRLLAETAIEVNKESGMNLLFHDSLTQHSGRDASHYS